MQQMTKVDNNFDVVVYLIVLSVCVDALRPSKQFISHVGDFLTSSAKQQIKRMAQRRNTSSQMSLELVDVS